ncbi:hypothetical protein B0H17DRAFT_1262945 [Mycena rosella]|uniref:Uncharacterized protein n=1 Tax=Mycena rosella TaxID=1033263 RepID=A0AAD7G408_MYCRO|nr:hypothetical protein B0H17DRAFT_1262945 [Mycena rosella]
MRRAAPPGAGPTLLRRLRRRSLMARPGAMLTPMPRDRTLAIQATANRPLRLIDTRAARRRHAITRGALPRRLAAMRIATTVHNGGHKSSTAEDALKRRSAVRARGSIPGTFVPGRGHRGLGVSQAPVPVFPPPGPFVAIPLPDVTTAERDSNGHPLFPIPDDRSDFVGSDDTEAATQHTQNWVTHDADRIRAAARRSVHPKTRKPTAADPAALGVWMLLNIERVADAENLLQWASSGCPYAYAKVLHLQQWYGLRPMLQRSAGLGAVMAKQQDARRGYLMTTMGAIPPSQSQRRRAAATDTIAMVAIATAPTAPVATVDEEMPQAPAEPTVDPRIAAFRPAYLGASPPGIDEGSVNSRSTINAAVDHWRNIPTSHWFRGMRNTKKEYPSAIHDQPLVDDVRAALTLLLWAPVTDAGGPGTDSNTEFIETCMDMFSCQGLYAMYVREGEYPFEIYGPEHYNFVTSSTSWAHAACWWSAHGLAPGTADEAAMESFACSYRNQPLGLAPWNTNWTEYPTGVECMGSLDKKEIIPWAQLEFPALCSGLNSLYPRHPGASSWAGEIST